MYESLEIASSIKAIKYCVVHLAKTRMSIHCMCVKMRTHNHGGLGVRSIVKVTCQNLDPSIQYRHTKPMTSNAVEAYIGWIACW